MTIVFFFIIQWYVSLFCQSIFHHRYSAHGIFTMSSFSEKCFFLLSFISQGPSYISAYAYGIMHRRHHIYTDTIEDPHSPKNSSNLFLMLWDTKNSYNDIYFEKIELEENLKKNLPRWEIFDKYAHNWITRIIWMFIYIVFWFEFATVWWQWLLLPLSMFIGTVQGAFVNYFAHIVGYRNYEMNNTSKNLYPFFDIFLWGEAYHNNHHKFPAKANHAIRWFEFDPMYYMMKIMDSVGIIQLKR